MAFIAFDTARLALETADRFANADGREEIRHPRVVGRHGGYAQRAFRYFIPGPLLVSQTCWLWGASYTRLQPGSTRSQSAAALVANAVSTRVYSEAIMAYVLKRPETRLNEAI